MFLFIHFSDLPWSPYFLFIRLEFKVESRIDSYRWDIDLMVVLCTFFTSDI